MINILLALCSLLVLLLCVPATYYALVYAAKIQFRFQTPSWEEER